MPLFFYLIHLTQLGVVAETPPKLVLAFSSILSVSHFFFCGDQLVKISISLLLIPHIYSSMLWNDRS